MLKKSAYFFIFFLLLTVFLSFPSCKGYKKTKNGLRYKILFDSAGTKLQVGDQAMAYFSFENEKDTFNSFKGHAGPTLFPVNESPFKGSLEEGLLLLSKGDSAIFLIRSDSLYMSMQGEVPKEISPNSYTKITVKVVDVLSKESVEKEREQKKQEYIEKRKKLLVQIDSLKQHYLDSASIKAQAQKDEKVLQDFLRKNKINAKRTKNGVYYVVNTDQQGPNIQIPDQVTAHYTAKVLDGKVFDSSRGREPFQFNIGFGEVIWGWEEALVNLSKGDKATLYIPSILGYGDRGIKNPQKPTEYLIPPNSCLEFEVEILDVQK